MVHWSAAPAPPRTERRRVTYRAAVARWPRARIIPAPGPTDCVEAMTAYAAFRNCATVRFRYCGISANLIE
jgi:hypothetical protein